MKQYINNPREIPLNLAASRVRERLRRRTSLRPTFGFVAASLIVVAGLMLSGCKPKDKGEAVTAENVKPVNPEASAQAQQDQRMKMAVAIRDGIMPPEPELKLKGGEPATPEVLEAYNQLLLRAMVQRREPPVSLQELQRWPLPRLPSPPSGKRIVYDPANCIVRLDPP